MGEILVLGRLIKLPLRLLNCLTADLFTIAMLSPVLNVDVFANFVHTQLSKTLGQVIHSQGHSPGQFDNHLLYDLFVHIKRQSVAVKYFH